MEASSSPHFIILNELAGMHPAGLNEFQWIIAPHVQTIALVWFALWCTTGVVVLRHLYREIREQSHHA